jgi:uncharacterized protein YkwD
MLPAAVGERSPVVSEDLDIPAGPNPGAVQQGLFVANGIRRQNGLPELTLDPVLAAVAQAQAEDMENRHYFSHDTPEGLTPFQRMQNAGVRYRAAAENIAMGTANAQRAFDMWLGSPGHRRNLLNNIYGRAGLGYSGGYWVHDFTD